MKIKKADAIIKQITSQFKTLRLGLDMSHEDLAQKSGVTRPAISHIESGKRKPSLHMSLRLADALGKNLSDILREAEKTHEKTGKLD